MRFPYRLMIWIGVAFLATFACQRLTSHEDVPVTSGQQVNAAHDFESINPSRAQELLDKNARIVLLDVRTPTEYYEGHLKDALLMDVTQEAEFLQKLADLDKKVPYIVYCRSGSRSLKACKLMRDAGIRTVYNVEGGYLAWPKPE
jgi:rhodanese-related sulfurtransferase